MKWAGSQYTWKTSDLHSRDLIGNIKVRDQWGILDIDGSIAFKFTFSKEDGWIGLASSGSEWELVGWSL